MQIYPILNLDFVIFFKFLVINLFIFVLGVLSGILMNFDDWCRNNNTATKRDPNKILTIR